MIYSVTLLQIVMLSPGIHLLKIMSPCPEPVKENKNESEIENAWAFM